MKAWWRRWAFTFFAHQKPEKPMKIYFPDIEFPRPPYLGGGSWKLTGLTSMTVLFGKNGSGKSQMLRAMRNINANVSHYVVPERAGEIDYQANHL
jgi:hypothetical protein